MSTTTQPRLVNGQYTFKAAGAPTTRLEDVEPKTVPPEQLYAVLRSMAGKATRIDGEDFDDLVQDMAEDVLRSYGGHGAIPLAPLKTIVSRKIDQAKGHTNLDARDRAAMSLLKSRMDEASRTLGRSLANREVEDLANQVRQEWPDPTHRPTKNFLQRARMGRLASIHTPEGTLIDAPSVWGDGTGAEAHDPNSPIHRATFHISHCTPHRPHSRARRRTCRLLDDARRSSPGSPEPARP
ncbi:hypothetical protein [Actinomyces urogenitalis]|uniref:hypothetical protein n=1 Tax=Actinomyces urogenitalis TaxID=103621 RepID=UPI0024307666|nr:hypothetical protein [Actinomyces urogenitalis]MCI7457601.1 hypothetical protein [Actinomyces urogenitalis]